MNLSLKLYGEFEKELAKSELQRSLLLAGVFAIGLAVMGINYFFIDTSILDFYGGKSTYLLANIALAIFIGYEVMILLWIKKQSALGRKISFRFKVIQTTVEISYMGLLMLYIIDVKNVYQFIDSPIQFLYFLFIILSILHLDFRICLLCGVLACVQFGGIIYYAYHYAGIPARYMPSLPENGFYIRCIVFVIASGVAGFVARQVKRRLQASLDFKFQKSEIEAHLGQQVSQEILATLTQEGGKAKKMEATVLVLDIRGFTKFSESLSLDQIQDFQNKFFGPVLDIVNQHRGVVNQILGDGVMATFGAPSPNALHADMAFQAALQILKKVRELCRDCVIPETRIGMGIHSGEVITGNIGSERRKQYSISGKAVIIAFRLEQLNKEFQSELLISEEVRRNIVCGHATINPLGTLPLKGLEGPIEVHQVTYAG